MSEIPTPEPAATPQPPVVPQPPPAPPADPTQYAAPPAPPIGPAQHPAQYPAPPAPPLYNQAPYNQAPYGQPGPYAAPYGAPAEQKSKIAAGLLGIFLGGLGIHNFYLGFTTKAVIQLLISVLSVGTLAIVSSIWGLIEGILILTGSENFRRDARGIPLRD
ncbi:TM2 domain-containing protein [Pseudarthrobacter sp. P1]|uniref:TM2 domain-containing protein n=1 Tax=Pseudarthrobacter sp. P1 TaxID=3418418 RepID=UPI003CECE46C